MKPQPISRAALTTFLCLTFASSATFWWLIIAGGGLGAPAGRYVFYLMWCPGVSALLNRLIFQRNLRGQGWLPWPPRWLAMGYLLPVAYAGVAYALVWALGLGGVDLTRFRTPVSTFVFLYAILCFAVMVVSLGFPLAWLRLRSGSVWPCALLHASHNLFIQAFLDRVTVDTGITHWLTTEFGAALAISVAWIFWRRRSAVETSAFVVPAPAAAPAAAIAS